MSRSAENSNAESLVTYWEDEIVNNQAGMVCPRNSKWLAKMLDVLPRGLRGKLAPYENCFKVSRSVVSARQRQPKNGRTVVRPVLR